MHVVLCCAASAEPEEEVPRDPTPEPPPPEIAAETVAAVAISNANANEEERHRPRSCLVRKWYDFQGYGFNLHAEKGKAGHFIGNIDPGSPAQEGGLKEGDIIVEVNGISIENDSHQSLVQKIKQDSTQVRLLVVDKEAKEYYQSREIRVHGGMDNVVFHESSIHEEPSKSFTAITHVPVLLKYRKSLA